MNMNIISQYDVEIIDGKLIVIDYDYYKPCNTLIHDPMNYILKMNERYFLERKWFKFYFDFDVKYLGSDIAINYWKREYEIKK